MTMLAAIALLSADAPPQQPVVEFQGLALGSNLEQAKEKIAGLKCGKEPAGQECRALSVAGFKTGAMSLMFVDGKDGKSSLYYIQVMIGDVGVLPSEALRAKFGAPTESIGDRMTWVKGDKVIRLRRECCRTFRWSIVYVDMPTFKIARSVAGAAEASKF